MKLTILSWNVNGLRKRHTDNHLNQLTETNPEIICMQETKGSEKQLRSTVNCFDDYHSYYSTYHDARYAGVAIYSKIEPLNIDYKFGKNKYLGRILKAEYTDFTLFNIYFPSGADSDKVVQEQKLKNKFTFYSHFLEHMEGLSNAGEKVVVCGDFNIAHNQLDLANPKYASKNPGFLQVERALIDRLIGHGFLDTFRMFNSEGDQYTWWSYGHNAREKNIGMRLDHFFITESLKDKVKDVFICSDVVGSDHCPIGIELVTK